MTIETIPIFSAAVVVIIGAIGGAAVLIINALRESEKKELKKLDNITVLVDGRYSEVLQEVADLKQLIAEETDLQVDKDKASAAQKIADEQEDRVRKSEKH